MGKVCNRRKLKNIGNNSKSTNGLQYLNSQMKNKKDKTRLHLLNARAKSSMESRIPIDNMIPPRAGA
jgi:hypothetical protein